MAINQPLSHIIADLQGSMKILASSFLFFGYNPGYFCYGAWVGLVSSLVPDHPLDTPPKKKNIWVMTDLQWD